MIALDSPIVQTTDKSNDFSLTPEELKVTIRKLTSKAEEMQMDLHYIAEELPAELDKLPEMAAKTYDIFCQLQNLKQQLKSLENS